MTKFGIEIEAYGVPMADVARALNEVGVNTFVEGYNHVVRENWKLVTDASLRNMKHAFELVSPILEGEAGLAEVELVGKVLLSIGAKVNSHCGFHTHVDARGLNVKQVGNVVKMFAKYESCFDKLVPASRRANPYCKSLLAGSTVENVFERVAQCKTVNQIRAHIGDYNRYKKLNLESLERHGTIEFRQHSGTVDPVKMVEWVKLVTGFVNAASEAKTIRITGKNELENLLSVTDAQGRKFFRERAVALAA